MYVGGNFINYRKPSTNNTWRSLLKIIIVVQLSSKTINGAICLSYSMQNPSGNLNNLCIKHLLFTKNREMSPLSIENHGNSSKISIRKKILQSFSTILQEFRSDKFYRCILPFAFARGFLLTKVAKLKFRWSFWGAEQV